MIHGEFAGLNIISVTLAGPGGFFELLRSMRE
jgi:hypothetical protein